MFWCVCERGFVTEMEGVEVKVKVKKSDGMMV